MGRALSLKLPIQHTNDAAGAKIQVYTLACPLSMFAGAKSRHEIEKRKNPSPAINYQQLVRVIILIFTINNIAAVSGCFSCSLLSVFDHPVDNL